MLGTLRRGKSRPNLFRAEVLEQKCCILRLREVCRGTWGTAGLAEGGSPDVSIIAGHEDGSESFAGSCEVKEVQRRE